MFSDGFIVGVSGFSCFLIGLVVLSSVFVVQWLCSNGLCNDVFWF